MSANVFAEPRHVTRLDECFFYHTMDIPGYGLVNGHWDLRHGIREYLGNVDFQSKRVLELGTASGFVCFHMERQGADVVAYDLSDGQDWDVVPFAQYDTAAFAKARKDHIRKLNNSFWLGHEAFGSRSKVVYGDVYSVPEAIGQVDVCTVCSILLHVRDPFLALQRALRLTRETVIVTDIARMIPLSNALFGVKKSLPKQLAPPTMKFRPDWRTKEPKETWWQLTPEIVQRFIGVLGFEKSTVTFHNQPYGDGPTKKPTGLFTVVGHRTVPL